MYSQSQVENILFLDAETVCQVPEYAALSERMQQQWDRKARRYLREEPDSTAEALFFEKAGIHAEFGKVVCISCAYVKYNDQGVPALHMKSYYGEDEAQILREFGKALEMFTEKKGWDLCAHNGKEFDFPFLGRRYIVQGIPLPSALRVQGKKPWEVKFVDTMEMWKFGDYKSYTSLDLLAAILNIPSPKSDIDGSQVSTVFWKEKDYERIKIYCEKDVRTTVQVFLRMSGLPLLPEEQ